MALPDLPGRASLPDFDPRPGPGETAIGPALARLRRELRRSRLLRASARSLMEATVGGILGHQPGAWQQRAPRMSWRLRLRDVSADQILHQLGERHGQRRILDIAVFVHGLLVDEQNWSLGSVPMPQALETHLGWAPVLVRYNTGLHISHNGRGLAALLEELHEAWGARLGRIRVIGHSMGGLVARSALEHLRRANAPVLEHVDQLFLLATPNQGADLERLGHAVEYALEQLTHAPDAWLLPGRGRDDGGGLWTPMALLDSVRSLTRATTAMPFRAALRVLAMRSDGMRDVRFGYMMAEEWESAAHDRDRFMLNHRRPIPPPDHVRTFCIAGSLWPEVGASPSPLRTDGLVSTRSAAGIGDDFDDLRVVEHGRYVEFPLLVHQLVAASQRVVEQMRRFSRVSSI